MLVIKNKIRLVVYALKQAVCPHKEVNYSYHRGSDGAYWESRYCRNCKKFLGAEQVHIDRHKEHVHEMQTPYH